MFGWKCVKYMLSSKAPNLLIIEKKINLIGMKRVAQKMCCVTCLDITIGGSGGEEFLVRV